MNYNHLLDQQFNQEVTETFWADSIVESPEIRRLEKQTFRWYYRLQPTRFYTSITTWLDKVMPTAFFLQQYYKENDKSYIDENLFIKATFGTLEHILMAAMLRDGSIDLNAIGAAVEATWQIHDIKQVQYLNELNTPEKWENQLKNDLLCILAFIQERNFKAHAIEWIGCYDGSDKIPMRWANAVDLVGELDFNGTRKTAIIDLKTGSLYPKHVFQLIGNWYSWLQFNPDIPIDLMMNLKPCKFTNKSKYKLKNHKISQDNLNDFSQYSAIASRNVIVKPKSYPVMEGEVKIDTDLNQFLLSPVEYVEQKHKTNEV